MKNTFISRIFRYIMPWTAFLFLVIFAGSFYYQSTVFISEKAEDIEVIIANRADVFEQQFREIKAEIAYVSRFESVLDALLDYPDMSQVERYRNSNQISDDLTGINLFNSYIEDIIIIGTNGFCKNLDSYGRLKAGIDPLQWESITSYKPGSSNFYFTLPYTADYYTTVPHLVFSVVLPVRENGAIIGYVQGNLNYERVTGMLYKSSGKTVGGTSFGAVTQDGKVVFSEGEEDLYDKVNAIIPAEVTANSGRFEIPDGGRQMVVYQKLSETDWIFLGMIDYRTMIAPVIREAGVLILLILPLSILLMSIVIYFLARRIQKPVERLKNRVENVDIETYEPEEISYEISEVQIVAERFEDSMQRNQKLIRHVYEEELLRKDVELEVLRNQITPHFIYNSLQLIKAEAVMSGNREVGRSVNALASLLHYSMDSSTDTVKLKEELTYISNYLEIYKKRYVDRFTYEITSDPSVQELWIPKMILQPLVENSIRHGFADVKTGGRILLQAVPDTEGICIRIEDNGCGMPPEQLQQLQNELEEASGRAAPGSGIGVLNVHRRIRLQCGEDSGIVSVGNCEGGGFCQVLHISPVHGSDE